MVFLAKKVSKIGGMENCKSTQHTAQNGDTRLRRHRVWFNHFPYILNLFTTFLSNSL